MKKKYLILIVMILCLIIPLMIKEYFTEWFYCASEYSNLSMPFLTVITIILLYLTFNEQQKLNKNQIENYNLIKNDKSYSGIFGIESILFQSELYLSKYSELEGILTFYQCLLKQIETNIILTNNSKMNLYKYSNLIFMCTLNFKKDKKEFNSLPIAQRIINQINAIESINNEKMS